MTCRVNSPKNIIGARLPVAIRASRILVQGSPPPPGRVARAPRKEEVVCDKLGLSTRENVKATTRPLRRIKRIGVRGFGPRQVSVFVTDFAATVAAAAVVAVGWMASRSIAVESQTATSCRFGRWHCHLAWNGRCLPGCYRDRRVSQHRRFHRARPIAIPSRGFFSVPTTTKNSTRYRSLVVTCVRVIRESASPELPERRRRGR